MARSQLLTDIVNGKESIENILLRLKVILSDLDNEPIMNWVNGELQGYKGNITAPMYRILKGQPIGTYLVNYTAKYSEAPVPLHHLLSGETIDELVTLKVTDSIAVIQDILNGENRNNYSKTIPTSLCHNISSGELQILGMRISFAANQLGGIVSMVKSKLVDIVIELENQYNDLDALDIKSQIEEDDSKKERVVYNIEKIIYEGSIEIGDKNKIGKTRIGNLFGGEKK
ncbi:hypothetical protein V1503_06205 [Bacillus sp. SCS-151]|uniref:AbiTii domain-containing protein n=1 Tax=Nanhaiella sioensis TaxID=3115293 RepID=UPI0039793051